MSVQWHVVLTEGLRSQEMIGVHRVIGDYVGRVPTRSEESAGRRAARRLARDGGARLVRVLADPGRGRGPVMMLVLCRPNADTGDADALESAATGRSRTTKAATPDPSELLPIIEHALNAAAAQAKAVDAGRLATDQARSFADALSPGIDELIRLRRRLRARRGPRLPT